MTAARRRDEILQALAGASGPVSAAALAARLGVSRQVVVGDVALLRAAGSPIVATPRGYVLGGGQEGGGVRCTVACRHGLDGLLDELYTVADCGCGVLDVTVEHPVYGQLSGQLQVFSRYDADVFWDALQKNGAQPPVQPDGRHPSAHARVPGRGAQSAGAGRTGGEGISDGPGKMTRLAAPGGSMPGAPAVLREPSDGRTR